MRESNQNAATCEEDAQTVFLTTVPGPRRHASGKPVPPRVDGAPSAAVFVDASGRRRRLIRWLALCALALAGGYGVLIVISLLGGPVPPNALLPVPGVAGAATPTGAPGTTPATNGGSAGADGGPSSGAHGPRVRTSTSAAPPSPTAAASSPASAAPSAAPSPTGHRPTAQPSHGRTASPTSTPGHGH